jgi:ferric-dicitrate binding protein FerR (iron transport regulator)
VSHADETTSGSRWEPAAQPAPATDEPRATMAESPAAPAAATGAPARPARRPGARRAALAAAAAAALLLTGGVGGFAVSTATAGEGTVSTNTA